MKQDIHTRLLQQTTRNQTMTPKRCVAAVRVVESDSKVEVSSFPV
jgi:hypothetical protein